MLNYIGEALASCALFLGALISASRWSSKMSIALLSIGIAIAALEIFSAISLSSFSAKSVSDLSPPGREWHDGWWRDMPPELRADSIGIARSEFVGRGRLIEYVDKTGNPVRFSPSEDDIREHDRRIALRMQFETWHTFGLAETNRWLVIVAAVLLLGYAIGAYARIRKLL